MIISVFGLGYVGFVTALCLAKSGHKVLGLEIDPVKIEMLKRGVSPIIEKDIDVFFAEVQKTRNFEIAMSSREAIEKSDVSFICVGTPGKKNGMIHLGYVERVCEEIGVAIGEKGAFHTVVLRSTVLPSVTRNVVIPILEKTSKKAIGDDFSVCYNPEFLREGSSIDDFFNPPKILIGEVDQSGGELLLELYENIEAPVFRTSLEVAEIVKYVNNAFHALKVVFANEMGNYCKLKGIDSHEVFDIFCEDRKLNISSAYLTPGFAFGGSCLPKDLRAVLYDGRMMDLELPVCEAILESNRLQVKKVVDMVEDLGRRRVGVLGFSFKAGTDDLRESPMVLLIERLLGKGYEIAIYDKNVSVGQLIGSNKQFIMDELPHFERLLKEDIKDVGEFGEIIIIGNKEEEYRDVVGIDLEKKYVLDLVRLWPNVDDIDNYSGICW
jgi:GDP-mannose 6-dehydrogenase